MKETLENIGVFTCDCGGTLFSQAEAKEIAAGIKDEGKAFENFFHLSILCSEDGLEHLSRSVRERGIKKLVFAGCSPVRNRNLMDALAKETGLTHGAVYGINIRGKSAGQAVSAINRAVKALSLIPVFQTKNVPLAGSVLVVGGGIAGMQAAREISALGHDTVLIERSNRMGGQIPGLFKSTGGDFSGAHSGLLAEVFPEGMMVQEALQKALPGVKIHTGSYLKELAGQVGSFKAKVQAPDGEVRLTCGAVVLAPGAGGKPEKGSAGGPDGSLFEHDSIVPMSDLKAFASGPKGRTRIREVGIILDLNIDETKAGTEAALLLARSLQQRDRRQVHLFCRDMRVAASGLEKLYAEVREAGVNIAKFAGKLELAAGVEGVSITYRDSILGLDMTLNCDLVGISPRGLSAAADSDLARLTGVSTDELGQLQDNNIHLFPEQTNRPGIFVVGACRGRHYLPQVIEEAGAAALAVHALLSEESLEVELSGALVDPDKCILCLTCIRSCPFKAMQIDRENGAAVSSPEACQKCGICAGECPARAIELPVYSDRVLLSQLE